jgi:hypothetical protein
VVEFNIVLVPQSLTLIVAGTWAKTFSVKKHKNSPNSIGNIACVFKENINILCHQLLINNLYEWADNIVT